MLRIQPLIHITHPLANHMSIQNSEYHLSNENSSEVAFFMGNDWVMEPIPEFAEYADVQAGDTRVYGWVPNEKIEKFLETYHTTH